jgi:hypothetical protein
MNLFAKTAMLISYLYYLAALSYMWIGQILGLHNDIWDIFDFPIMAESPPMWTLIIGLGVSASALYALGSAYLGVWSILKGGREQDFRKLARNLRKIAWGLLGFWLSYNILSGALPYLITIHIPDKSEFDFGWDPLDLDIVFAILGIALLAISQTLERAWIAEDETKHFL